MKKTLLASLLAATSLSAFAADYYVVVPMKGKTNSLSAINVALQAATLPVAKVGQAYSHDLAQHLLVTGDPTLNLSQATLSTADALPSGLSLASNGVLSGTPTTKTPGVSFQVVAAYKSKTGQQAYTIVVNGATLDVTQIVGGGYHTCAVTTAGGVKCWGRNDFGQLGDNSTVRRLTPVDVTGLTSGVSSVSGGGYHTCAVTTAGGVKCWGHNAHGQLGDSSTINRLTPVDVTGFTSGVSSVGAGASHTCAVTTAGGVKCWGYNLYGQLGDNSTTSRLTPVDVPGLTSGVSSVGVGSYHTCAVTTAGGVKCWGNNAHGQLGDNSTINRGTPLDVTRLTSGVSSVDVGGYHTCAVTTAGGVKCWGYNLYGQLGDNSTINRLTPVDVTGLTSGVSSVDVGEIHACAVTTAGGAKCWGYNGYGQLGDNSTANRGTPVDVPGLTSGVSSVGAGDYHTCAVTTAGGVKCWGYNGEGQLGDNSTTSRLTPVDAVAP